MSETLDMHALADGQLEGEALAAANQQIADDPQARAEFETVALLKSTVKRACPPVTDPEVWKACKGRLDAIDRSKKAEVFIGRHAWALCGLFAVLIFSAAMFNRMNGRNKLYTGDMARMMSSMSPLPFSIGEPAQVQKQLQAELGATPIQVPSGGLRPTGMLRGFIDGRRAMLVDMADADGPARLIVIENVHEVEGLHQSDGEPMFIVGRLNDMNAVSWRSGDFLCILVGDREVGALCDAAGRIRIFR